MRASWVNRACPRLGARQHFGDLQEVGGFSKREPKRRIRSDLCRDGRCYSGRGQAECRRASRALPRLRSADFGGICKCSEDRGLDREWAAGEHEAVRRARPGCEGKIGHSANLVLSSRRLGMWHRGRVPRRRSWVGWSCGMLIPLLAPGSCVWRADSTRGLL